MIPSGLQRVLSRIEEIEGRFSLSSPSPVTSKPAGRIEVKREDSSFEELISEYARQNKLDPDLVDRVVQAESGYDPQAVSPRGAMGLMQLMPGTCDFLGVNDPFDPRENLAGGTKYLRGLLDQFGDLRLALAAYNAGPSRVKEYGGVPPFSETESYLKKILGE
ncbi:MAG: hypothetical protein PWP04_383 [Candidatus Atribacteria bacterium]|nr:hypothetical protein [Candidatus Atribacteria bacterium]